MIVVDSHLHEHISLTNSDNIADDVHREGDLQ